MIQLNAKLILMRLLFIDLLFIVMHLVIVSTGLAEALGLTPAERWINLDVEYNIPAWFSGSQLVLLALLAMVRSKQLSAQDKHALRRLYVLMAGVFLFFSLDEIIKIHETGLRVLSIWLGLYTPLPDDQGVWMFVYPGALFFAIWLFRGGLMDFLKEAPGRRAYLLGAAVFVLGGMVVEVFGYYLDANGLENTLVKQLEITLEEGCELLGQSTMVYALLVKIGSFSASLKGA